MFKDFPLAWKPLMPEHMGKEMTGHMELAKAYIPYQMLYKIYEPAGALKRGTLFPELYRPYGKMKKREEDEKSE